MTTEKYVFLSYSSTDRAYVAALAGALVAAGIPVWYDREIDSGTRFEPEIQARIEQSSAMVVVMTPASYASKWVTNERYLAEKLHKPILPLLLEGEVFLGLNHLNFTDVRSAAMPSAGFVEQLRSYTAQRLDYVGELERDFHLKSDGWKVSYSPDGQRLATACENGWVEVWDASVASRSTRVAALREPVYAIAWSPSGRYLAIAATDGRLSVVDVRLSVARVAS